MDFRIRPLLALLAFTFACLPGRAQSTEADLFINLVHKPLYLRGLCADEKLHFDANGQLLDLFSPSECANYLVNAGYGSV